MRSIQKEMLTQYRMLSIDPSWPSRGLEFGPKPPAWVSEGPVYEVFVRSFSAEGSFAGVEKKCAYLKDLGVKTVWLMPVHPIGLSGRKGKLGSPYAIMDHKAINPEYGTKKDFKRLVDAVHDHDLRIIIDMVINHTARDHVNFYEKPEMFNQKFLRSPDEWSDVRELNYGNAETQAYSLEVLKYWLEEFGIDGYRCDVAGLVPLDFWEAAAEIMLQINPDVYLLAEWENRALQNRAFHSNYDWTTYLLMKEVLAGRSPASDFQEWHDEQKNSYPANTLPLRFTENHDLPRTLNTFGKKHFFPFIAFTMFSGGIPLINNGQEIGAGTELSLFDYCKIDWNHRNEKIYNFYQSIIRIRNSRRKIFMDDQIYLLNDCPQSVISFTGKNSNEIIVLNFSAEKIKIKIQSLESCPSGSFFDLITESKVIPTEGKIVIGPWQVQVLKKT